MSLYLDSENFKIQVKTTSLSKNITMTHDTDIDRSQIYSSLNMYHKLYKYINIFHKCDDIIVDSL